jgi:hypothetical protein
MAANGSDLVLSVPTETCEEAVTLTPTLDTVDEKIENCDEMNTSTNTADELMPSNVDLQSKLRPIQHSKLKPISIDAAASNNNPSSLSSATLSFEQALLVGSGSNMPAKVNIIQPKVHKSAPSSKKTLKRPQLLSSSSIVSHSSSDTSASVDTSIRVDNNTVVNNTFANRVGGWPKATRLASGLAGSLGTSRRPCDDFFYREVLVTR